MSGEAALQMQDSRDRANQLAKPLLIVLVFLASLLLTMGIPLAWLWLVGKLIDQYATAYVLALVGAPVMMILWMRLVLGPLNRAYLRSARHPIPLLEASVTISVALALLALAIWAILFGSGREVWGPWPG